jgi:hypothetical protein
MSEVYRWGVPVPLNLPHRVTEDDVYNGQWIPKGSLVGYALIEKTLLMNNLVMPGLRQCLVYLP